MAEVAPPLRPVLRLLMHRHRAFDRHAAKGVDQYVANGRITQDRIRRYWGRDAPIVYPPVDVERFSIGEPGDHVLFVGELVRHKRPDLAIEAAAAAGRRIKIVGTGPELGPLKARYETRGRVPRPSGRPGAGAAVLRGRRARRAERRGVRPRLGGGAGRGPAGGRHRRGRRERDGDHGERGCWSKAATRARSPRALRATSPASTPAPSRLTRCVSAATRSNRACRRSSRPPAGSRPAHWRDPLPSDHLSDPPARNPAPDPELALPRSALRRLLSRGLVRAGLVTYLFSALTLVANLVSGVVFARALGPDGRGVTVALTTVSQLAGFLFALGVAQSLSYFIARRPEDGPSLLTTWLLMLAAADSGGDRDHRAAAAHDLRADDGEADRWAAGSSSRSCWWSAWS